MLIDRKFFKKNLVSTISELSIGDTVVFFDAENGEDVWAEVLGFPHPSVEPLILFQNKDTGIIGVANLSECKVFKICMVRNSPPLRQCECGARFTSNPAFHLTYCPLFSRHSPIGS